MLSWLGNDRYEQLLAIFSMKLRKTERNSGACILVCVNEWILVNRSSVARSEKPVEAANCIMLK